MNELVKIIYESFLNTKVNLNKRLQQERVIKAEEELLKGLCDEKVKAYQKFDDERFKCEDLEIQRAIKYTLKLMREFYSNKETK